MSEQVSSAYAFLGELTAEERTVAEARESDRALVLRLLAELPGDRLANIGLH